MAESTEPGSITAGKKQAPSTLVLVRHGQSVGNVADERAHDEGLERLDIETRDADTPLSEQGQAQARALGEHLASLPADQQPEIVLCSPYQRARRTAEIALEVAGLDRKLVFDERLRERDLGVLDGYTRRGIEAAFPEEAERRSRVGKFYYRPAGGESWCDVALRIRSLMLDVRNEYDGEVVWVFTHQAVIMAFRLVLESLDEAAVLGAERERPIGNVSTTTYHRNTDGALELHSFADTAHLERSDAPVTAEPPASAEPR